MPLTTHATVTVEYASDGGPLTASPTWNAITSYALDVSFQRGRSSWLSAMSAGTCTIRLKSFNREFDPDYGSKLTGWQLGRQIRVRATIPVGGTTYDLFRGHIEEIEQSYDLARNDTVVVTATDLLGLLGNYQLNTAHHMVVKSLSPTMWWGFDETATEGASTPVRDLTGNGYDGLGSWDPVSPLESGGASAASNVSASRGGPMGTTGNQYSFGFYVRAVQEAATTSTVTIPGYGTVTVVNDPGPAMQLTVGNVTVLSTSSGLLSVSYAGTAIGTTTLTPFDGTPHYTVVVRDGDQITVYVDAVAVFVGNGSGTGNDPLSTVALTTAGTVDELVVYRTALDSATVSSLYQAAATGWVGDTSNARIARILDVVGVPSGRYSLDTGSTSCGPVPVGTTAADHLQAIAAGEDGRLFVNGAGTVKFHSKTHDADESSAVTFTDVPGGGALMRDFSVRHSRRDLVNDITVNAGNGGGAASDSTSKTSYGAKSTSLTTALSSSGSASSLAAYLLSRLKDPVARPGAIEARVGTTGTNTWAGALELGSKITRTFTPAGTGSGITKTEMVDSMQHRIGPAAWDVAYTTAPYDSGRATLFRWGTSNWDGSDLWAWG